MTDFVLSITDQAIELPELEGARPNVGRAAPADTTETAAPVVAGVAPATTSSPAAPAIDTASAPRAPEAENPVVALTRVPDVVDFAGNVTAQDDGPQTKTLQGEAPGTEAFAALSVPPRLAVEETAPNAPAVPAPQEPVTLVTDALNGLEAPETLGTSQAASGPVARTGPGADVITDLAAIRAPAPSDLAPGFTTRAPIPQQPVVALSALSEKLAPPETSIAALAEPSTPTAVASRNVSPVTALSLLDTPSFADLLPGVTTRAPAPHVPVTALLAVPELVIAGLAPAPLVIDSQEAFSKLVEATKFLSVNRLQPAIPDATPVALTRAPLPRAPVTAQATVRELAQAPAASGLPDALPQAATLSEEWTAGLAGTIRVAAATPAPATDPILETAPPAPIGQLDTPVAVIADPMPLFVAGNRVNMRAGPSTEFDVLETLSRGAPVEGFETQGRWTQVMVAGPDGLPVKGWMSSSFLSDNPLPAAPKRTVRRKVRKKAAPAPMMMMQMTPPPIPKTVKIKRKERMMKGLFGAL